MRGQEHPPRPEVRITSLAATNCFHFRNSSTSGQIILSQTMTRTKNKSPAKELRDLKRSISFIRRKESNSKPNLSIYPQHYLSISPDNGPALTLTNLLSVSVAPKAPMKPKLEFSRTFYCSVSGCSNSCSY